MIVLPEIAQKLQDILNANPGTDLKYIVNTPGFHLDRISDHITKTNFIPVFISTLGGQNNPIPILKQTEGTIPVTFYYPVRFKDKMFALQEYLNEQLIGKMINWGELSGTILTNVSLPRFGEIQGLDLKQFETWVSSNYQREIDVMEPFISMELTIYLSAVGEEFIYGNNVKITNISINYKGTTIFEDNNPICVDRVVMGSSEPAAQQTFNDTFSKGFPANASYTKQLPLIVKNNESYYKLIDVCEKKKDIQNLVITVTENIPIQITEVIEGQQTTHNLEVTHDYYITNYSRRTSLGQLLGISLTLADIIKEV